MSSSARYPQVERPQKMWCADCGLTFFNLGFHRERCDGKAVPFPACGRSIVKFGGRVKAKCCLRSGHDGRCE